jgi:hypothetical protein
LQHQQRRRFGQCLLFAPQFALQFPHPALIGLRCRAAGRLARLTGIGLFARVVSQIISPVISHIDSGAIEGDFSH